MDYFAEKITQFVRKNEEKYCQLSQEIWRYAELAFHEEKSSQALIQMLAQEGFAITTGLAGIPTAFGWQNTAAESRWWAFWGSMMRCLL